MKCMPSVTPSATGPHRSGQHRAKIDVARLVVRRIGVGEIRRQYSDALPLQQQRLSWIPKMLSNMRLPPVGIAVARGVPTAKAAAKARQTATHSNCRLRRRNSARHRPQAARFCRRKPFGLLTLAIGGPGAASGTGLAYSLENAHSAKISSRLSHSPRRGGRDCHRVVCVRAALGVCGISDPQDIAQLEALAKSEAVLQFPKLTDRQRFIVGPIEPHLPFDKCMRPIRPVVASPQHMKDRIMIELRCQDPKPWHLYVPVRIVGTSPVVVALHAIAHRDAKAGPY